LPVQGLEEKPQASAQPNAAVTLGSPAASVPWSAHSLDRILFRGTSPFQAPEFSPELMIALANLGSALKPKGKLLIPVSGPDGEDAARWQRQLAVFPGTARIRELSSGLRAYLALAFLFGGLYRACVLEFTIARKPVSRLEWHRLAREAVLSRVQPPAAA
jgi:hypothetical protein